MLVLVGVVVVTVAVLAGFTLSGGPLRVLLQPYEFLIIFGAASGYLLIGTPPALLRLLLRQVQGALRATPYDKALHLDGLQLVYELLVKAKKEGLIALEKDLAAPEQSPIFSAHPRFMAQLEAVRFTCEALGMLVDGTLRADDFEGALDAHLETHHEEVARPATVLQRVGDALPGLGIVAAVLGIVITMQHVDGKPEEIGQHVAAALIGTFVGVLLCYGYVQPLAANLESQAAAEDRFLRCLKTGLVAFARGAPPLVAVELARHVVFSDARPEAEELAAACQAGAQRTR